MPDFALDRHTQRGRQMGRGPEFWYQEASIIAPEGDVPNPYLEETKRYDQEGRKYPKEEPRPRRGEGDASEDDSGQGSLEML